MSTLTTDQVCAGVHGFVHGFIRNGFGHIELEVSLHDREHFVEDGALILECQIGNTYIGSVKAALNDRDERTYAYNVGHRNGASGLKSSTLKRLSGILAKYEAGPVHANGFLACIVHMLGAAKVRYVFLSNDTNWIGRSDSKELCRRIDLRNANDVLALGDYVNRATDEIWSKVNAALIPLARAEIEQERLAKAA